MTAGCTVKAMAAFKHSARELGANARSDSRLANRRRLSSCVQCRLELRNKAIHALRHHALHEREHECHYASRLQFPDEAQSRSVWRGLDRPCAPERHCPVAPVPLYEARRIVAHVLKDEARFSAEHARDFAERCAGPDGAIGHEARIALDSNRAGTHSIASLRTLTFYRRECVTRRVTSSSRLRSMFPFVKARRFKFK